MTYKQKPYTGSLFKNDKGDNPSRPDWRGSVMLADGHKIWVSAWEKTSQQGEVYFSLSLNEAQEPAPSAHNKAKADGYQPQPDDGDEIAF